MMNALYTRYLWYLSLLMDAFLLGVIPLAAWSEERGVRLEFIQPGKPVQNAYSESFNGPGKPTDNDCIFP